jgi:hypothetical protein
MAWKRKERRHWYSGGQQLLISHPEHLSADELAECPPGLLTSFHGWHAALDQLPSSFQWAKGDLRARTLLLERSTFPGPPPSESLRVYWSLRYVLLNDLKRLKAPCFGSRSGGTRCDAPGAYGWLARTFGTVCLAEEESGTAHWGQRLGQIDPMRMFDDTMESLPPQAKDWWVLYELDGDWVAWDAKEDRIHWTGTEWTGFADQAIQAPAQRVISFMFWRLLEAGRIQPSDLEMLGT